VTPEPFATVRRFPKRLYHYPLGAGAHATADDNSLGWVELVPELKTQPVQVDLLNLPANGACLLRTLGCNTSLPAGDYQQIRLLLVPDNPGSGAGTSPNACATLGQVCNCVVDSRNNVSDLQLSSQANTGLKIPPGQVVGGPIHVAAGQSVDINVDFNACASIIQEGNGKFRLKPTLTAGVVSTNTTGINGQVVDSVTSQPIARATVALENADKSATIQGIVTALNGAAGANIDVSISALQSVSLSGGATRPVTVPLLQSSTSNIAVQSAIPCPATGSPMGAFCAQYTLVVRASNPNVGSFSAGKITFSPPATGDVFYTVEADAARPMSGTNLDTNGMPLKVTAGTTASAKELDFAGCS
jgi:hypothetical protein